MRNTLEILILWQLDKVLCKWFTIMCSEVKPVSGPIVIQKAKSCYVAMKIFLCVISHCDTQIKKGRGSGEVNYDYIFAVFYSVLCHMF